MLVSFVRPLNDLTLKNSTFVDHVDLHLGDDSIPVWLSTAEWNKLRSYHQGYKDVASKWVRFNIDLKDTQTATLFSMEFLGWVDSCS
jgi:hypothetical protein